nr:ABC transporter substrate-binding protein [Piscinibacter sp. XHJ-5]
MERIVVAFAGLALSLSLCAPPSVAGEVEVLHFWTSPGEAKSLAELKALIAVRGHTWKDFAVVGGAGGNAMTALKQRVMAGHSPSSASIKGPAVQEWASMGALAKLDSMAQFEHWDKVLPEVVQEHVKHKGSYVAVPVNIHRANWLWSNLDVLRKAGVQAPPSSFDQFLVAAEKARSAGFVAVAHGGQPWQDFILFESVALGVAGADLYRRAFVQLEPAALSASEMRRSLQAFRQLKPYVDDKSRGRDWNAATDMVIQGKAAFQFMGDWAKGEFIAAGRKPGTHFSCTPAWDSGNAFTYVVDTFAMFQLRNWEAQKAQGYLAYVLLGTEFQQKFNQRKGSIPVRMDIPLDGFDDCAKASRKDFDDSAKVHALLPSVAVGMAPGTTTQAALQAVVSEFWNNDALTVDEAIGRLVRAAAVK